MNRRASISCGIALLLSQANLLCAQSVDSGSAGVPDDLWQSQTTAKPFSGLDETLANLGIVADLSLTSIYQQNVKGGLSTHRRAGRNSGSYDMQLSADLQELLGIEGAIVFVHTEGWWSKSGGIDGPSVGSVFGVNADARPRRSADVTELWYEQSMLDGAFLLRVGKMDLTGGFECSGCPVAFDTSAFSNDETRQFLNGAGQQSDDSFPRLRPRGGRLLQPDRRLVPRRRRGRCSKRRQGNGPANHVSQRRLFLLYL